MRRTTVIALFEDIAEARAALREIRSRFAWRRAGIRVLVRSVRTPAAELRLDETDASRSLVHGALWGAFGAMVAAGLGTLVGQHWIGFDSHTVVFAVLAGLVIGTLGGALLGSTNPNLAIGQLSQLAHEGGVVLTVESPDVASAAIVENIFRRHSGRMFEPHAGTSPAQHLA